METTEAKTESLIPYEFNNRNHDQQQVDRIANSIQQFGFNQPIVVDDDNVILVGHGRLLAAQKLGLKKVPVLKKTGLTETQKKAYRILDNKLQNDSTWSFDNLELELGFLEDNGFELEPWGLEELRDLFTPEEPEVYEDEGGGALPDETYIKRGDVIELGPHRVMCGDSTSTEDVVRLMAGQRAALCFTSPPYGQQREYTKECEEKVLDWDGLMRGAFANLPMAEGGQVLVNLGMIHREGEWVPYWNGWIEWMRTQGWRSFGWYVWDQGFGLPGDWNGRFAPSHEFIFHFNKIAVQPSKCQAKKPENIKARHKGGSTMRGKDGVCKDFTNPEASAQPNKIPDSIVRINRMHGGHSVDHPAIFPVEFPAFVMGCWDGLAYEPFCGSGTTLIAADQLNRICYGMEISPKYCQVIIERYQKHCEKVGKPFECKINGEAFNG